MKAEESNTEKILDELKIGTPNTSVPVDYLMDNNNTPTSYLKRIYERHQERTIEDAVEKAGRKAKRDILRHMFDIEQEVPRDKRAKLTILYATKYKNRLSLVGFKRFVLKNKDLSAEQIDKEFNRTMDWSSLEL